MIFCPFSLPNGALATFHKVNEIRSLYPFSHTTVETFSYVSENAFLTGSNYMWASRATIPQLQIAGSVLESVEEWLVSSAESPFHGGHIAADQSDTLDAAKERAWGAVKAARAAAEVGGFEYDGSIYDVDNTHVTGAVLLASLAKSAGAPYSETWTLFDDTTRDLDADQVIALGIALGQRVSEIYATARSLRDQIAAATTGAEIDAIKWPA
ncbi:MAG: DUF4376 domain-containing protein [Pseudomonadota bacterium]|nr:DUF4376 domain-containing protein [Pseudomonadota bacterium]